MLVNIPRWTLLDPHWPTDCLLEEINPQAFLDREGRIGFAALTPVTHLSITTVPQNIKAIILQDKTNSLQDIAERSFPEKFANFAFKHYLLKRHSDQCRRAKTQTYEEIDLKYSMEIQLKRKGDLICRAKLVQATISVEMTFGTSAVFTIRPIPPFWKYCNKYEDGDFFLKKIKLGRTYLKC